MIGRKAIGAGRVRTAAAGYLFVLPFLALMCAFVFYPLGNAVWLTFQDVHFLTNVSRFVGVQNYVDWATDPTMWRSLWTSIQFIVYYLPAKVVIGLVIALIIDRVRRARIAAIYRAIFYFPVILPGAIVFQMWMLIYDPSVGVFPQVFQALHLRLVINWLGDPRLALPAIAIMQVWMSVGSEVILFLVGLAGIPDELLEAARVDGAGELRAIWSIVLPLLRPIFFIVLVLSLGIIDLTAPPLFMTQGGPIDATTTYGLQAYYQFAKYDQWGYASTWYVAFSVLTTVVAILMWRYLRLRPSER